MQEISVDASQRIPLLKAQLHPSRAGSALPVRRSHTHPNGSAEGGENASIYFIGTATTVIEWSGLRILTDPNFLHAGDHVHLGPGVTAERLSNPAVELDQLPTPDCVLLSHYHEDHFDKLVEEALNRDVRIITTEHARDCLTRGDREEPFRNVHALGFFDKIKLNIVGAGDENADRQQRLAVKITGMPGKHVPPGPLSVANDLLKAVPPTNGWMLELGRLDAEGDGLQTGYRIYISGDTLFVDDLKQIPEWLGGRRVDLMVIHLGGTTIPGPKAPLVMVTMDAKQGVQLMQLVDPEVTVPVHFDDYSVFLSPLGDFKDEIEKVGLGEKVVFLDRGEEYRFKVRNMKGA